MILLRHHHRCSLSHSPVGGGDVLPVREIINFHNIIKSKWDGVRFDWKVSVEISIKGELTKSRQNKLPRQKRKALARELARLQQAEVPTLGNFLFTRTYERMNRELN